MFVIKRILQIQSKIFSSLGCLTDLKNVPLFSYPLYILHLHLLVHFHILTLVNLVSFHSMVIKMKNTPWNGSQSLDTEFEMEYS